MALITLRNPETGEQQAVDAASYVPPQNVGDAFYGWEKLCDGLPLADQRAAKRSAIDVRLATAFAAGFTPATGPLAGHVLQTRDLTDRTNWLTSQAAYSAQVSAGNGATLEAAFRDGANETIVCSYADGLTTLLDMAAWGKALMQNSWALKDQVDAAADEATLDAIDIETGWQ